VRWRGGFFAALLPLVPLCQIRVDRALGEFRPQHEVLYLESAERIRQLVPGFEGIAADVYWLRTVQYYGGQRAFSTEKRYELLRPLIDITTSLDPRLELAYRYGATFLSETWPMGAGKPGEGVEVLEKGIKALPQSWRLRWDLGSVWFFYLKDARRAADVLVEASRIPGAPYWLESLAGSMLVKGDRAVSREIWQRQYDTGEGGMKDNALYHLRLLDALDGRDALNALVARFAEKSGRSPTSLEELVSAGLLRSVPADPAGTPYEYDAAKGRVRISRHSLLWNPKYEED
jgi:hypothetical protein